MDTNALAALAQEAFGKVAELEAAIADQAGVRSHAIPTAGAAKRKTYMVTLKIGSDEPRDDLATWNYWWDECAGGHEFTFVELDIDDQRDNPGGPYQCWNYLTLMVRAGESAGHPRDWSWRDWLPLDSQEECVELDDCDELPEAALFDAILDRCEGDGGLHEAVAAARSGRTSFQHPEDAPGTKRPAVLHILSEIAALLEGELHECEPAGGGVQQNAEAMGRLADHLAKWEN